MSITLEFNLQDITKASLEIPWSDWFTIWLESLSEDLPNSPENSYELSLRLTNDAEIQSFNLAYRSQDKPTDVLSFSALEVESPKIEAANFEPLYLGDIIISLETAEKQAKEQGHSLTMEMAWLSSHGLLHLLGWDHPDQANLEVMVGLQAKMLAIVGLPGSVLEEKYRLLL